VPVAHATIFDWDNKDFGRDPNRLGGLAVYGHKNIP